MVYYAGKLIENLKLFYKSKRPHFLWVYRRDNPLKNTRKACESLAFGSQSWFTSIPIALPASQVVYHAGKPIESVVYCLDKLTDKQAQLDCPVDFSWRYK